MSAKTSAAPRRRARLMVVDDHDLVRQGVRALISGIPDWTLCAETGDALEVVTLATETKPDIVIVDISIPNVSGLDLIVQLRKALPQVQVLVHTMHQSEQIAIQAVRAGARGYVFKTDPAETLIEAITSLSRHQPFFPAGISENLLEIFLNPPRGDAHQLTARERQVVKLIAEGRSNKEVARVLQVSRKTVESHRAAAMRKIGAKSAADIALYAVRNGLVQ